MAATSTDNLMIFIVITLLVFYFLNRYAVRLNIIIVGFFIIFRRNL